MQSNVIVWTKAMAKWQIEDILYEDTFRKNVTQ